MLKLVHDAGDPPPPEIRVIGLLAGVRALKTFTTLEIKRHYQAIEAARDGLSQLLDKADGKDA
jgi:hypothetical protein